MPFQGTAMPAAGEAQLTGAPALADRSVRKPYRVAQVAALLDVHPATVYRDIDAGRLKALRVGSGKGALRIMPDAFDAYLSLLEVRAVAEVA
jgi:excisionase family DNA binding protein